MRLLRSCPDDPMPRDYQQQDDRPADSAGPSPVIRPIEGEEDLTQCVQLQRDTWGDDFRELVAPAVLQVAQKVGGLALGAFAATGDLVGFVFGLTGIRDGRPAHWSHMLAVREGWRDRGIGRSLKTAQRGRLRAMGVPTMYWSFDPLVARNAHLNLHRLGATVVEYVRNLYGVNPMSRTDAVIGSDRFVVAWDLTGVPSAPSTGGDAAGPVITLVGESPIRLPDAPEVLVEIPLDVHELKRRDPHRAVEWRQLTCEAFEHYLARGYHVAGFLRGGPGRRGRYVLIASGRPG